MCPVPVRIESSKLLTKTTSKVGELNLLHLKEEQLKDKQQSVRSLFRWCRERYFGHLQRLNKNSWPRRVNISTLERCHH